VPSARHGGLHASSVVGYGAGTTSPRRAPARRSFRPSAADGIRSQGSTRRGRRPLAAIYREATQRAGKVFEVLQVQSLDPRALQASLGLYLATTVAPGSLPRWFRELLAASVSRWNECR
jgi:hypothetical protein